LAVLTVIVAAAVLALSALTQDSSDGLATNVPWVLVAVAFAAVGVAVARRQPRNSIGWLLIAFGLVFLLSYVGNTYAVIDYRHHHGALPLGLGAVFLGVL
jgi:FtsH-binding integral membrane protein